MKLSATIIAALATKQADAFWFDNVKSLWSTTTTKDSVPVQSTETKLDYNSYPRPSGGVYTNTYKLPNQAAPSPQVKPVETRPSSSFSILNPSNLYGSNVPVKPIVSVEPEPLRPEVQSAPGTGTVDVMPSLTASRPEYKPVTASFYQQGYFPETDFAYVPTPPKPVEVVEPPKPVNAIPQTACKDSYSRCVTLTQQCHLTSIKMFCTKSCGLCNRPYYQKEETTVIQEPIQPVIQEPVQPVIQEPVQPVINEPVKPVIPEPAIPGANCADTYNRCPTWKHRCDLASIKTFCPKTCGGCQPTVEIVTVPVTTEKPMTTTPPPATEAPATPEVPIVVTTTTAAPIKTTTEFEGSAQVPEEVDSEPSDDIPVDMEPTEIIQEAPAVVEEVPVPVEAAAEEEPAAVEEEPVAVEEETVAVEETAAVEEPSPVEDRLPALSEADCTDELDNCFEFVSYGFCDYRPGDANFSNYLPVMKGCMATCGLCDRNMACADLAAAGKCGEPGISGICPASCVINL